MRSPMVRGCALLALIVAACSSEAGSGDVVQLVPPVDPATGLRVAGFGPVPELPDWSDNPASEGKKALGKAIFFDPRLSGSGTGTCGNCHLSLTNFQSGAPLDLPDRSYPSLAPTLPRHAPSLLNIVYASMMRWDGSHFVDLFDMAIFPMAEANMNLSARLPASDVEGVDVAGAQTMLAKKLTSDIPGYAAGFQSEFGEDLAAFAPPAVWRLAGKAVASYLRVAVSRDAAFDRWNAGDPAAISESAVRGFALFRGRAECGVCHSGPLFSDFQFHNVSTALPDASGNRADEGRRRVTDLAEDGGKFLTPMLRTVALTSPYLHDGSESSIAKIIRQKTGARGHSDPNHDPILDSAPELTDAEVDDIVAFLKTLTGKAINQADLVAPLTLPK